ncbi:hypothetical protein NDU88_001980 [Pleurodeles waltl]|uniref:Uncharacterized protein n=1 Tax=Pleurodeles waltl TaxID=8319 RepID=A0AAV7KUA8_PLEWA|nr:hypothetical protein NDU88_001980 [Pleurodeles waltl]
MLTGRVWQKAGSGPHCCGTHTLLSPGTGSEVGVTPRAYNTHPGAGPAAAATRDGVSNRARIPSWGRLAGFALPQHFSPLSPWAGERLLSLETTSCPPKPRERFSVPQKRLPSLVAPGSPPVPQKRLRPLVAQGETIRPSRAPPVPLGPGSGSPRGPRSALLS